MSLEVEVGTFSQVEKAYISFVFNVAWLKKCLRHTFMISVFKLRPDSAQETFREILRVEIPFANSQTEEGLNYDRGSYVTSHGYHPQAQRKKVVTSSPSTEQVWTILEQCTIRELLICSPLIDYSPQDAILPTLTALSSAFLGVQLLDQAFINFPSVCWELHPISPYNKRSRILLRGSINVTVREELKSPEATSASETMPNNALTISVQWRTIILLEGFSSDILDAITL
ncbi:hypothetical protein C8J55DRAFT_490688 [Lentinula edodes]|uniref:Uncharacterized protein n=1 Tax=Lentinula lateritia TaxID=40482 RepID=A0A9W9DJU6_9AGAR|nr:hypothetical protein C8J55DRAFT_490688 [Lentinula edodes]